MAPSKVLHTIEQHVLVDGFKIVIDLDKSRGSYLLNRVDNSRLNDFYGFFGSAPVGFNHPHFDNPEVQRDLLRAAKVKIANSDIYSTGYAEFIATFERVVGLPPLQRYLFIEGGALTRAQKVKQCWFRHRFPRVSLFRWLSRRSSSAVSEPRYFLVRFLVVSICPYCLSGHSTTDFVLISISLPQ